MVGKKLGILFLGAVVLSFLSGYFIQNLMPAYFSVKKDESFDFITNYLKDHYYYQLDEKDIDQAYIDSLFSMVESYSQAKNDPYTRMIAIPKTSGSMSEEFYIGLGISIAFEGYHLRVLDINHQSDAFGKLLPNDLIIGVKEDDTTILFEKLSHPSDVVTYLAKNIDDVIHLVIKTPDLDIFDVDVMIREILTPSVETFDINEDEIAYLKINIFNAYMHDQSPGTSYLFKQALTQLEQNKLLLDPQTKTLILDLRDNPGGALTALHNQWSDTNLYIPGIIQDLLPRSLEQPIFSMIPRDQNQARHFNNSRMQPKPYDIKVLVNENSASAAEVLAATLYAHGNYTIYGMPTYGKNVYQSSVSLFEYKGVEYGLIFTEGKWYYDGDKNIENDPIPVVEILQQGFLTVDTPMYPGLIQKDQVSQALSSYQQFLNAYFKDVLNYTLRKDGYFDEATEITLETFQFLVGLPVTGQIDRETAMVIYMMLVEYRNQLDVDVQLQTLISLIKNT